MAAVAIILAGLRLQGYGGWPFPIEISGDRTRDTDPLDSRSAPEVCW